MQGVTGGRGKIRVWSVGVTRAGCGRWVGPGQGVVGGRGQARRTWPLPAGRGRGQRGRRVRGGAGAAMAAAPRWRERLFALYFLSHIPITALIDLQPLLPAGIAPRAVSGAGGRAGARSANACGASAGLMGPGAAFAESRVWRHRGAGGRETAENV